MHVGIIMDGNRRFARSNGRQAYSGHADGFETLKQLLSDLKEHDLGIRELSLYAFSTENFKRDEHELEQSFALFRRASRELEDEVFDDVRVRFVGRLDLFPGDIHDSMLRIAESHTEGDLTVNFLVGYDGQDEIVDAVKRIVKRGTHPDDIGRSSIKADSYLPSSMPVDLIIRTGMEDGARLSGFMLWHASYSELIFLDEYWPEFSHSMLSECIEVFNERQRRYGR